MAVCPQQRTGDAQVHGMAMQPASKTPTAHSCRPPAPRVCFTFCPKREEEEATRRRRLELQQRASEAAGHHATSPPALTAHPERPGLGHVTAFLRGPHSSTNPERLGHPHPACCLRCALPAPGRKTGQGHVSFILLPGGTSLAVPAPRTAPISQPSLAHPSARSQCFAEP